MMVLLSSFKRISFGMFKYKPLIKYRSVSNPLTFCRTSSSLRDFLNVFLISRAIQSSPKTLKVEFSDSLSTYFHYIWLRDSCRCNKCINVRTRQKVFDTSSLDLNITPRFCHVTKGGELKIVWPEGNDEHVSIYDPVWLHRYAMGFEKNVEVHDFLPRIEYWTKDILEENLPQYDYHSVMQSQAIVNLSLESIHKYGILVMRNVPCEPGEVVSVMDRIAQIKNTRWGSSFHITSDDAFRNPACIPQKRENVDLHTDMDYLEKSPGYQAIHCLEMNDNGSSASEDDNVDKSVFVDGFHVANWMRKHHPVYFDTLSTVPVKFRLLTNSMHYMSYQTILRLTASRDVAEVHFNNRHMAPLEGPSKDVETFFSAYKMFAENIGKPENQLRLALKPGDLVIVSNRRVLHGRGPLNRHAMTKHLEGCFADLDDVIARYRAFVMQKDKTN